MPSITTFILVKSTYCDAEHNLNLLSLAGLILVPPPIWIILGSFRTVVTTCVYKFLLKREVTPLQFTGAVMIVMSIVLAKLGDVVGADGGNVIPVLAIVYSVIASINSVGVSIYQELLFKVILNI